LEVLEHSVGKEDPQANIAKVEEPVAVALQQILKSEYYT
jgi:hypothetical protein